MSLPDLARRSDFETENGESRRHLSNRFQKIVWKKGARLIEYMYGADADGYRLKLREHARYESEPSSKLLTSYGIPA
jgi:hypothetical protein